MNLIFDMNNMANIHFYPNKDAGDDEWLGMTLQSCFHGIRNIFSKFKPKRVVLAFDSYSWRKVYTKDLNNCVTHLKYKGGRDKNKTPKELKRKKALDDELINLRELLKTHSNAIVLFANFLEADDLIAGFINLHPTEDHVIVSSDKDFMQLIDDNVKLFNPVGGDFRDLSLHENDRELFLFEKCFRGDTGDHIISSYPRLRKNKIFEAYRNEFTKNNIMEHQYEMDHIDESGELKTFTYTTREVFEENLYLMGLNHQPEEIKTLINKTIDNELQKNRTFSVFHFLKYCGKHDLPLIIKNVESFIPLFNTR